MIKVGLDLVKNERITAQLSNPLFIKKVFHASELKISSKIPGIFALKEAAMKAIGKKLNWHDLEVMVKEGKKPRISFSQGLALKKIKSLDCSISHDGEYTIGIVVLEL